MPLRGPLPTILTFLLRPRARYVLAWLLALLAGGVSFYVSWTAFDKPRDPYHPVIRPGGNAGHTYVDFGGQWLMGGMAAHGWGQHLYHRQYQRELLRQAYPEADEIPPEEWTSDEPYDHEADRLMSWMVAIEDPKPALAKAAFAAPFASATVLDELCISSALTARSPELAAEAIAPEIGGPLYPPIHALLMYPLGCLSPAHGYRAAQVAALILALVSGWGICRLARGRVWWPIATTAVIIYPGFISSMNLGQNANLMLALVLWGWVLLLDGRPFLGGMLWGILAFKPVWLAALLLTPLLTRRWRFALGMGASALLLVAATLPIVGWFSWLEWFQIGRVASRNYGLDHNWVYLSRDLLNVPRRWLFDFEHDPSPTVERVADIIGWSLLLFVFEITVRFTLLRGKHGRADRGPMAAFLLLGSWLCCYHFMYYDVLLTALPVYLLLEAGRFFRPRLLVYREAADAVSQLDVAGYYEPRWADSYPLGLQRPEQPAPVFVLSSMTLSLISIFAVTDWFFPGLGISVSVSAGGLSSTIVPMPLKFSTSVMGTPWNLFCLLALWLWTGWLTASTKLVEHRSNIRSPH
jgi:hypothetical protein